MIKHQRLTFTGRQSDFSVIALCQSNADTHSLFPSAGLWLFVDNTTACCYYTTQSRRGQARFSAKRRNASNGVQFASPTPYLPWGTPFPLGTPFPCGGRIRRPAKNPIAFPCQNIYNGNGQQKGRPVGCYQHPPARMQENEPLPHSRYNCACFSLYPFPCILSRGEMRLCVCSGVGNCKSLRRFCCLTGKPTGDGKGKYHPQRLTVEAGIKPCRTARLHKKNA